VKTILQSGGFASSVLLMKAKSGSSVAPNAATPGASTTDSLVLFQYFF
jgi:hypothetical protein